MEGAKKKRRKCVSKAERLAKRAQQRDCNEDDVLEKMHSLMQTNRSEDWDHAWRIATTELIQAHFLANLLEKQHGKAAAHYLKRWRPSNYMAHLEVLLQTKRLREALDKNDAAAAGFLNHFAKDSWKQDTLNMLLNEFVIPWIAEGKDAPLQILLHDFSSLKWSLLEHALITGQGAHLVNQFAYVTQELSGHSLVPWWSDDSFVSSDIEREKIRQTVESTLQQVWPDAKVFLIGSSMTKLYEIGDDVDMCVLVPSSPVKATESADLALDMQGHLALYSLPDSFVVKNARIPIIKATDPITHLKLDISINNIASLWNSIMVCTFMDRFSHLRQLCHCIRKWAKSRALVGSSHTLSSYSIVLLVIYWLQVRGYVPFVDIPFNDTILTSPIAIKQVIDTAFNEACVLSQKMVPTVPELLVDFFVFWSSEFSYSTQIASLRRREAIKEKSSTTLFLEDPIEITRNLGIYLNRDSQRVFRNEMVRVCVLLRHWCVKPSKNLMLHSLDYGNNLPLTKVFDEQSILSKCILRPRSPYSGCYSMTGDLASLERDFVTIATITGEEVGEAIVQEALNQCVVGLDCEGSGLGRCGQISVVSISIGSRVFLFDILVNTELIKILKPLLESEVVIKVLHDCRKDSDALYHQYGVELKNVFDTQIGHAILQMNRGKHHRDSVKYVQVSAKDFITVRNSKHECIAFGDLLWNTLSVNEASKDEMKKSMTQSTWTSRPLTEELENYAAVDVIYLPLLYRIMKIGLDREAQKLCNGRIEKYLSCRTWRFSSLEALVPGDTIPGYINNITQKQIFVTISQSTTITIPITSYLSEPGSLNELSIGDSVTLTILSNEGGRLTTQFPITSIT